MLFGKAVVMPTYPVAVRFSRWTLRAAMVCSAATSALPGLCAQQLSAAATQALVADAAHIQVEDMRHGGWAVRYRVHRVDGKEDSVRDLVETADGNVARTLEHNGQALAPEQQALEAQRLQRIAQSGLKHHDSNGFDRYGTDLVNAMPTAMDYTWVPSQPQLPNSAGTQVVLDFQPRPGFKPASTAQSLLKGLSGRIWIDGQTHHLVRIEVTVLQDLDVAFGLLARVYKGGRVVYEQLPVGDDHDVYTTIQVDVRLRELMVKTVPYHLALHTSDRRLLPAVPTLQEGVAMLLAK